MARTVAYPSQTVVTTGTTVKVAMLPLGVRAMPDISMTAVAAPAAPIANLVTTAEIAIGAVAVPVAATTVAIPARGRIRFANGAQAIVTTAQAVGSTSLPVSYVSQAVPVGTIAIWNGGGNQAASATQIEAAGGLGIGSMVIPVAALTAEIDAGAILTFGAVRATVTDYCPAGSTALEDLPLTAAITANTAATYQALLNLAGATNATPSPQPKTVDTTTYLSGIGKEMVVTQIAATLKLEYNLQVGDRGGEIITQVMLNPANYNREIFAEIVRPGDGTYKGAAIATQSSDTAPVQDIAKRSVDMQFQGVSFSYTPLPRF
jgi:hypothetical protein